MPSYPFSRALLPKLIAHLNKSDFIQILPHFNIVTFQIVNISIFEYYQIMASVAHLSHRRINITLVT